MHIHKCHLQPSRGGGIDASSKVAKWSLAQEWLQTGSVAVRSECAHETPSNNDCLFYQLDTKIPYFTTFIIFLYMFRALLCSSS